MNFGFKKVWLLSNHKSSVFASNVQRFTFYFFCRFYRNPIRIGAKKYKMLLPLLSLSLYLILHGVNRTLFNLERWFITLLLYWQYSINLKTRILLYHLLTIRFCVSAFKCCNNFHPSWLIYGSHKALLCKAFCKLLKLFFVYLCLSWNFWKWLPIFQ